VKSKWIIAIIAIFIIVLIAGYSIPVLGPSFGFREYKTPTGEFEREKTIWDWLELLIIPLVLAGGVYYLNKEERKLEREIAKDHQQEAALQAYINYMTELLLEKNLNTSKSKQVRTIARIRTLTVLRGLDARRKGDVMDFLNEAGLINLPNPVVNLSSADFRNANLVGADLSNTHLQDVNMKGAVLHFAHLDGAVLIGAELSEAKLNSATLTGTNLTSVSLKDALLNGAKLSGANLLLANFKNATLFKTNLKDAKNISRQQLEIAKTLKGATMPDGTKHE